MSEYFNPKKCNMTIPLKRRERIRITNTISLTCYVNKNELDKIIKNILIKFCNSAVLGYDRSKDKYWCKKYKKTICDFHLEIKIIYDKFGDTQIEIIPLIGYNDDIELFINDFNEAIYMYKKSNFIRCILNTD
jgi:hypothetical protein